MAAGAIRMLPGLGQLKPARQGALDRFCGLYAIINAIDLALWPVRRLMPAERKSLYDSGIAFLARSKWLETVAREGMSERRWIRLRDTLIDALDAPGAPRLKVSVLPQPHADIGLRELLRWIERQIAQGQPVMLVLWGAYDHFTVVAGITPTKLLLFDSYGFKHVARSSLGIRKPRATERHKVSLRSVASLSLVGRLGC